DVRPLADSLGVARQLQWYPLLTQAELARRYQEATALVAPFRDEGLGLVAIEAQLSEAPVVAFRSGGLTDIVVHEQTGLLVPTGGGDRAAEVTALAAGQLAWAPILLSGVLVFAAYALLIQTWRVMLASWDKPLSFGSATRIWFVSNLGKYLPGKVWQIAALSVLAQQEGVSAVAATGSALIVNLANI